MSHSPSFYALWRIALGLYLLVHFAGLFPVGTELFSNAGMLPDRDTVPLLGILPSPLQASDAPGVVAALIVLGGLASLALLVGWYDRVAAVLAWLVLAWLFARNPLIANPGMPYLGWLLLFHACVPRLPFGALHREPDQVGAWRIPRPWSRPCWKKAPRWTFGKTMARRRYC